MGPVFQRLHISESFKYSDESQCEQNSRLLDKSLLLDHAVIRSVLEWASLGSSLPSAALTQVCVQQQPQWQLKSAKWVYLHQRNQQILHLPAHPHCGEQSLNPEKESLQ